MSSEYVEREESSAWPSHKPVWTITALVLAIVMTVGTAVWEYTQEWTPFQKQYLVTYIASIARPWIGVAYYPLLFRIEGKQRRQAVDADLDDPAVTSGKAKLQWERHKYKSTDIERWLRENIYQNQTPWALLLDTPWKVGLVVLIVGWMYALPRDKRRQRALKYGRRTKGPELVTADEFNRRNQSDGVGFMVKARRSLPGYLLGFVLGRKQKWVCIPRELESSHFLLLGDTGGGKSSLIRQILIQVEERDETAIVYDPALEYTPQFYNPARGDVILNPLDERMPYWSPCDEVRHEAEAEGLAAALFKDDPNSNQFFITVPRQIFAHLLAEQRQRSPHDLLAILRDEDVLAKRLKGTQYAAALYPEAGSQRGGMMASINSVSNALKLLPHRDETKTSWTAREWAEHRRGWLFITSKPEFEERLQPLISMWLDMLIVRTMSRGKPGVRPVWFILDELQKLNELPKLHTAITESRKAGNPLVLGFQGRSQLEELYGKNAETMLSQPATKVFLKTQEPKSAQWISQTIGTVELERMRETHTHEQKNDGHESRNYQLERVTEPLVMDSQIQGLSNLEGYLKSGNLVVHFSTNYVDLPKRHKGFIEREIAPEDMREEDAQSFSAGASGQGDSEHRLSIPEWNPQANLLPPTPPKPPESSEKPRRNSKANDDDIPYLE